MQVEAPLMLALLVLSPALAAQATQPKAILKGGDPVPGGGVFDGADLLAINDSGTWIATVDAFQELSGADVLLSSEGELLRIGDPVPGLEEASITGWRGIAINARGEVMHAPRTLQVEGDRLVGAFWGSTRTWLQGDTIPSRFLGRGTTLDLVNFIDHSEHALFVTGTINNPDLVRVREQAVIRFDLDERRRVTGHEVLATEGMFIPELGVSVYSVGPTPATYGFTAPLMANREGHFIATLRARTFPLPRSIISIDYEHVLAVERGISPVAGKKWVGAFGSVAINDRKQYAYAGLVSASESGFPHEFLIVKNGEEFVQEGDILPLFQDEPMSSAIPTPLFLTNGGDLFWVAFGEKDAFMRNREPIVQALETVIDGRVVSTLLNRSFAVSPDGRFFICYVLLKPDATLSRQALVLVDFGLALPFSGCADNPGNLSVAAGRPLAGEHLELSMDAGGVPGTLPRIVVSTRRAGTGTDCGIRTRAGELLVSLAHRVAVLDLPPWTGTGPSTVRLDIPSDLSLINEAFYAQGFFSQPGTGRLRLTNALRIEIGAP